MDPKLLQAILPVVVIGVVLALRFRSMSKVRPLKTKTLWIAPVMLLALVAVTLYQAPPSAIGLSTGMPQPSRLGGPKPADRA